MYGDFTAYGAYGATGFQTGAHDTGSFPADPLFGALPADDASATGSYDTVHWLPGDHGTPHHAPYTAGHHAVHDTGAYGMTTWTTGYQQQAVVPPQSGPVDTSGQWDASAWPQPDQQAADSTQQWDWGTQVFDTGAYDATQWNSDGAASAAEDFGGADPHDPQDQYDQHDQHGEPSSAQEEPATSEMPAVPPLPDDEEEETAADPGPVPAPRTASRSAGRSRRRSPAKRSALLTVAVPSVCVMGVAGIAAASVGGLADEDKDTSATAADTPTVKASEANAKLDLQLRNVSAGADDFAGRASRYQERIDLKAKQAAELRKAAEEAARRERLRPKFALPVLPKGLSAFFGQAGVNWMSAHTGIDFPVPYGTTVMAATDGTVRTQWNSAYGNMMIVTAMDGTETWYCHLSSYQVPSGTTVKAGQPIAFSGNSGNSTGPHLHFEVRPAGGSPIDPLAWLRSHGLNPL
ncbi:M23 family metallopeptidase [Streptomyces thermoalcalitolerans]|uniref:M23 family metallopeptidase n=1 Tax=Streptomyces thermoalcalitolerans TaxID=65605 RepID=A0ABP3ZSC0_9ACTN